MSRDERHILLRFTLVMVTLLTLGGALLRGYLAHTLDSETNVQLAFLDLALRDRSRYLAETLQPHRENGGWPENLADILTRNHADFNRDIFLQVFETDGRLVAASVNAPKSLGLSATTRRDGLREVRWLTEETSDSTGRAIRLLTYPVYLGNPSARDVRVLGFAQAGLPLPDAARAVARFTWVMALGLAGLGALVILALRVAMTLAADRFSRETEGLHAAQNHFIGDAAHELGTPLAILRGEIDIALRRERSPDEYRAALARAPANAV